jgi:hypothetical protein
VRAFLAILCTNGCEMVLHRVFSCENIEEGHHHQTIEYFPVPGKYSGFQYGSLHHQFIGMSKESA